MHPFISLKDLSMNQISNLQAAAAAVVEEMASDVRNVLSDGALASKPQIKALRERVEAKLAVARELAAEKRQQAAAKAKEAAGAAHAYARDEPWKVAAGALAVGVLVGLLVGRSDD